MAKFWIWVTRKLVVLSQTQRNDDERRAYHSTKYMTYSESDNSEGFIYKGVIFKRLSMGATRASAVSGP